MVEGVDDADDVDDAADAADAAGAADAVDAAEAGDAVDEEGADAVSESTAEETTEPVDPASVVDDLDLPVLLFDGVCNLCNGLVRFVVRFDHEGTFRFAPLQSPVGQALLERHDLDTRDFDTMVLVEPDGEVATKSTAALRIFRRLDGPWPLFWPLVYLPRGLRDAVYGVVSRNRYRVFGKKEECPIPEPEIRERFAERSLE